MITLPSRPQSLLGFAGLLCLLLTPLVLTPAATAQSPPGTFEGVLGLYMPDVSDADDSFSLAIRGGYRANQYFAVQGSISRFELDKAAPDLLFPVDTRTDAETFIYEFSLMFYPGGGDFLIYAGPSLSDLELDVTFEDPNMPGTLLTEKISDDSFGYHVGIGYEFRVGLPDTFYIRPDVRLRSIDMDIYDSEDLEFTIGFGGRF